MEILNYLGKFHPVVLHLPIGALYLTFCLFLLEKFFKTKYTIPIRFGLLFSFAFSVLSAALGYFLYLGDDFSGDLIDRHMWLGISTTLFIGGLLWIHKTSKYLNYFTPSFVVTIILLSITGHFGGQITHGSEYLKLPDFSKPNNVASLDSVNLYNSVVMPILDNKCVKCHNQNKSKGDLMLNSKEAILKGGESGSILVSFDSSSSHLYNYPNLPMADKMHMPPEGNSQLTENEIELLRIWIDNGAEFEKFNSIKDILLENVKSHLQDEKIKDSKLITKDGDEETIIPSAEIVDFTKKFRAQFNNDYNTSNKNMSTIVTEYRQVKPSSVKVIEQLDEFKSLTDKQKEEVKSAPNLFMSYALTKAYSNNK